MTNTLIEIRDLRVSFAGAEVVHGINLDIRRGECMALVGESGSGKSVTAHSILRLLPGKAVSIWCMPAKPSCAACAATALR